VVPASQTSHAGTIAAVVQALSCESWWCSSLFHNRQKVHLSHMLRRLLQNSAIRVTDCLNCAYALQLEHAERT